MNREHELSGFLRERGGRMEQWCRSHERWEPWTLTLLPWTLEAVDVLSEGDTE